MKHSLHFLFLLFSIVLSQTVQSQSTQKEVVDQIQAFQSTPKEIAYLHLNKSILLRGEQLGFSAYVVNQKNLKPSLETTNLYVQVKDSNNVVVKEKMVLIEKGTGASSFNIDSTFTNGTYSVIAFTNWMRNFKQQYFFDEKIQIINTSLDYKEKNIKSLGKIDAQFLPESGHLLKNTPNTLGIVLKDSLGYGLADAYVRILNQENKLIGNTKLNRFGIGKIEFIPEDSNKFHAIINYKGREFTREIETRIENHGIVISSVHKENKVDIFLKTNTESLERLAQKKYLLTVQNPNGIISYEILFDEENILRIPVEYKDLNPGMNIITLFDSSKNAIAERLFFNYKNLSISTINKPTVQKKKDSLRLVLPTRKFADSTFLSVSILPENTIADKRNHNIMSYFMLQPHIKGVIEDAAWYFKDVDETKKTALDNLLITQGWSSYDWQSIFDEKQDVRYGFEKYVEMKAVINNRKEKDQRYLVHASSTNAPTYVDIPEGKDSFVFENIVPIEGENLFISRIKKNDDLIPAGLSVQFFPHHIKKFKQQGYSLAQKSHLYAIKPKANFSRFNNFGEDVEQLDEVLIETEVTKAVKRERKLNNHTWGRVHVLTDQDKMLYPTLGDYLISRGLQVRKGFGGVFEVSNSLSNASPSSGEGREGREGNQGIVLGPGGADRTGVDLENNMLFYLDGQPLMDSEIFYNFSMMNIDYIEIERHGMGSGFLGSNGTVKVYSDFTRSENRWSAKDQSQKFDFPLAYALNKEFYVPRYGNTSDEFFQQFGVIGWKSNLTAAENEDISFVINKPNVNFKLIIEGFTSEGQLIYDVKSVSIK